MSLMDIKHEIFNKNSIVKKAYDSTILFIKKKLKTKKKHSTLVIFLGKKSKEHKTFLKSINRSTFVFTKSVRKLNSHHQKKISKMVRKKKIKYVHIFEETKSHDRLTVKSSFQQPLINNLLRQKNISISTNEKKLFGLDAVNESKWEYPSIDSLSILPIHFIQSIFRLEVRTLCDQRNSFEVRYDATKIKVNIPYNIIELNEETAVIKQINENDLVIVYNAKNSKFTICCVKILSSIDDDFARLGHYVKRKLLHDINPQLLIHPLKKLVIEDVSIQNVELVAANIISVSPNIYSELLRNNYEMIEIFNPYTNAALDLPMASIQVEPSLKSNAIKLNYMQREYLEMEQPPNILKQAFLKKFIDKCETDEDKNLLLKYYENGKVFQSNDYNERLKLKKVLKKVGYFNLNIYFLPIKESKQRKIKKLNPYRIFLNWAIRPSSINLRVIRPYASDEASNIVRISKNTMNILGIEENDFVTISYRNKKIQVPVLEMSNSDAIKETNIITSDNAINLAIAMPAHLRNELGILQINKICTINRNLPFLFRKNWNKQFLPLIALIFTIINLEIQNFIYKLLLLLLIFPLSSYISLSPIREKISKKRGSQHG